MNIKITYNWLLEYLETDATPEELQKYLSLCGPSVERIEKVGDDYVFDIEVTSNRVDMASVFGIAQEAQAILPMFGKKARIKSNPLENYTFDSIPETHNEKQLDLHLTDPHLASRVSAIVISNATIKPSPTSIRKRLEMCNIRSINNVVDISNYLMLSLGQPTHTFDYDKIKDHKMIIRESKKGETIMTLDDKKFTLPGGDIVVEDGSGELIDLAGIMGGRDSAVSEHTKNVLLFIETYNKKRIRKTSMLTGQRSVAATYFEKGLDEERVEPTLVYGIKLLQEYAGGTIGSKVYDIYPNPYKTKIILVSQTDITRILGVDISSDKVLLILNNLGFETQKRPNGVYQIMIPSWRKDDVEIKADIVEEIARIYGYQNLPNEIQQTIYIKQPHDVALLFTIQQKVKYFLKHIGLHEVMNYSMVSKELLESLDLRPSQHLELLNTISEEIRYFRQSLIPSLVKNMKENEGRKDILTFFEIAKIYVPIKNDLPTEKYKLSLATNTSFSDIKGILEALFKELNITDFSYAVAGDHLLNPQAHVMVAGHKVGKIGQLKATLQDRLQIKESVFLGELDFEELITHYRLVTPYTPQSQYATVKLDLTLEQKQDMNFEKMKKKAFEISPLLKQVELINTYKNNITIRCYFSSSEQNITEDEAKGELAKIKRNVA